MGSGLPRLEDSIIGFRNLHLQNTRSLSATLLVWIMLRSFIRRVHLQYRRLDGCSELASRTSVWTLSRWHIDPGHDFCQQPRLCAYQLARHHARMGRGRTHLHSECMGQRLDAVDQQRFASHSLYRFLGHRRHSMDALTEKHPRNRLYPIRKRGWFLVNHSSIDGGTTVCDLRLDL